MTDQKKDIYDIIREVVDLIKPLPEEDQMTTIRWVCDRLGITTVGAVKTVQPDTAHSEGFNGITQPSTQQVCPKDIKTFIAGKNPISDNHFATAVAYYYQFEAASKKEAITKDDLVEATRLVGRDRIKRPDQTLVNATHAGYLDNISRGLYKLNSVGENLVAMTLPNSDCTLPTPKRRKKVTKRNTKPNKKK